MEAPLFVNRATLGRIAERGVAVPDYGPAAVRPGIVHLGLGGFHRAHMARYTHELMNLDAGALDWGIVGAGLLPADARMREALAPQDWLYTLVERDSDGERATVIGSLCDVIVAADDRAALPIVPATCRRQRPAGATPTSA